MILRLIENAKNESYIRSQDYFALLTHISYNPIGTKLVWDFLRYINLNSTHTSKFEMKCDN